MLKEYQLKNPVLERITRMIDEVDEVQEVTVEPAANGLDLICRDIRLYKPREPYHRAGRPGRLRAERAFAIY